ncbi:MAG: APC family permease, partial [Polaromonas sp.]|nr:APC family permease [Polaromonas sp.]
MAGATKTPSPAGAAEQPSLHRVMGPWLLLLFIVGDILGTGIYALTGQVAKQVGGVVWLPFLVAFAVALVTAFSYLELVTKYPRAAGAALYVHKAFGVHFITFIVAFAVMCSGITSASTASRAFAANLAGAFSLDLGSGFGITAVGLGFMALVAAVNLRGVGESVKANVLLTCVELTGLLIIIGIGFWAIGTGQGHVGRVLEFKATTDGGSAFWSVIAGTSLAFFAMVGFEDSVNMAEESKDPSRIFPKVMLAGLAITGLVYVLVSIAAITLVPPDKLAEGETPLLQVVQAGAPGFPVELFGFITMFAVANSALINMLMASRLVYGMS